MRRASRGRVRGGRALLALAAVALLAVGGRHGLPGRASADVPGVALVQIGTFSAPLDVVSPPGDPTRLFVVERGGTVRVVKNGVVLPAPFIDVSGEIGQGGERGLLSLAFAPDFAVSGLAYSFGTLTNGTLTVWEHHVAPGADAADPGHRVVLSIPHPATNHNGGQLQFGPDGSLYVGVGDGGTDANGQDLTTPLGKILRIDPRVASGYAIPPGQPFAAGAAPVIWAYGLRNPWRFSFDRLTGDLVIGDVGDTSWEEVDRLPAGQAPGANLGWPCLEGTHAHSPCTAPGAVAPVFEYPHEGAHCSISGGYVARDPTVPALAGRYLFADYCGTGASAIDLDHTSDVVTLGAGKRIAGFGADSDGHLYVTSLEGAVWRIAGTGDADKPPVANFTISDTTPPVGAVVHLDASASTDPDGKIVSYSWDVDGDGTPDGKGVTFDTAYPSAGARAITLTVGDAVGARSTRTQAVYVGGKRTPPGAVRLDATLRGGRQGLAAVRRHGLRLRFRSNLPATWKLTATMWKTARAPHGRYRAARGVLARTTVKARSTSGTVRLRLPARRLARMRGVIVRVQAQVQADGRTLRRSLLVRVGA
jgi:glucose/arabinose dehydrogenase